MKEMYFWNGIIVINIDYGIEQLELTTATHHDTIILYFDTILFISFMFMQLEVIIINKYINNNI